MKEAREKTLYALGLVILSGALMALYILAYGNPGYVYKYLLLHVAFLPIHALVIGIIIEGVFSMRQHSERRRKMNMFVGIFFRQMGVDILLRMTALVENWSQLEEIILVDKSWTAFHFKLARQKVERFPLVMKADNQLLGDFFDLLHTREEAIIQMTRNPYLLDFDSFYHCLLTLFHLIEESHIRGDVRQLHHTVAVHLSDDVSKSLRNMLKIWLNYLEFLKREHPVLFSFRMGIHNVLDPEMIESDWKNKGGAEKSA